MSIMRHDAGCPQFRHSAGRREFLTAGALSGLGLSLPGLFQLQREARGGENARSGFGRAKSVIVMFLHGGHPQHETFDPKPHAPAEVRGEFGEIETRVPGTKFGELFPLCATIADKLTVIRCISHGNTNHVQACLPAWTGHAHPPAARSRGDFPPSESDFPPFGAVVDSVRPSKELPTWVRVGPLMTRNNGTVLHGQLPGFLGRKHGPFIVDQNLTGPRVAIEATRARDSLHAARLRGRRDLMRRLDDQRRLLDASALARELDSHYERAFNLLTSDSVHRAFDLASEPEKMRDQYGRGQFGQSCLLARRLAESRAPLITVHFCRTPRGSWDTHSRNFTKMKQSLAPTLDRALWSLTTDLDARGMLDETLVMVLAEFGRTPKINRNAGRDHWPFVYSLAMCGAGVKPGVVHGGSDRLGAYPASQAHSPSDLAATIYHLLGVPPETELHDATGRPHRLVIGKPIEGVLA